MTEKIDVIGPNAHPFYKWARDNYEKMQFQMNFQKYKKMAKLLKLFQ